MGAARALDGRLGEMGSGSLYGKRFEVAMRGGFW
jgi:hypothetical protein